MHPNNSCPIHKGAKIRVKNRLHTRFGVAARLGALRAAGTFAIRTVRHEGVRSLVRRLPPGWGWLPRVWSPGVWDHKLALEEEYQQWLAENAPDDTALNQFRREAEDLSYTPTISILMPVYDTDPTWLVRAIESVMAQVYGRWELCAVDDGSPTLAPARILRSYEARDHRIKVRILEQNEGISRASQAALELATGDFIALLDHDDELKPHALVRTVQRLNQQAEIDLLFTDEDKEEEAGRLVEPTFKPGWSPELLLTMNYVGHLVCMRTSLAREIGGFREGYEGSQDYDLLLRATERTDRVIHLAEPLYTWRKISGSAALSQRAKPYAYDAGRRALEDAVRRRGLAAEVIPLSPARYRVRHRLTGTPKISLVIPTRDRKDLLERCIDSVRKKSTYDNFDITIVDNESTEPETSIFLDSFDGAVVAKPGAFNFSALVNAGAGATDGEFILLLNNDIEVISPEWLEAMLEHAQRDRVAAVGARLLYPGGRVQHEGILVGVGGTAMNADHRGYLRLGESVRECSAVTAACMLIPKPVYEKLGGFDENLAVAYNDVDFCLRARDAGYTIIYTPFAELRHHEAASRRGFSPRADRALFESRWESYVEPYYNPNFDPDTPFHLTIGRPGTSDQTV